MLQGVNGWIYLRHEIYQSAVLLALEYSNQMKVGKEREAWVHNLASLLWIQVVDGGGA